MDTTVPEKQMESFLIQQGTVRHTENRIMSLCFVSARNIPSEAVAAKDVCYVGDSVAHNLRLDFWTGQKVMFSAVRDYSSNAPHVWKVVCLWTTQRPSSAFKIKDWKHTVANFYTDTGLMSNVLVGHVGELEVRLDSERRILKSLYSKLQGNLNNEMSHKFGGKLRELLSSDRDLEYVEKTYGSVSDYFQYHCTIFRETKKGYIRSAGNAKHFFQYLEYSLPNDLFGEELYHHFKDEEELIQEYNSEEEVLCMRTRTRTKLRALMKENTWTRQSLRTRKNRNTKKKKKRWHRYVKIPEYKYVVSRPTTQKRAKSSDLRKRTSTIPVVTKTEGKVSGFDKNKGTSKKPILKTRTKNSDLEKRAPTIPVVPKTEEKLSEFGNNKGTWKKPARKTRTKPSDLGKRDPIIPLAITTEEKIFGYDNNKCISKNPSQRTRAQTRRKPSDLGKRSPTIPPVFTTEENTSEVDNNNADKRKNLSQRTRAQMKTKPSDLGKRPTTIPLVVTTEEKVSEFGNNNNKGKRKKRNQRKSTQTTTKPILGKGTQTKRKPMDLGKRIPNIPLVFTTKGYASEFDDDKNNNTDIWKKPIQRMSSQTETKPSGFGKRNLTIPLAITTDEMVSEFDKNLKQRIPRTKRNSNTRSRVEDVDQMKSGNECQVNHENGEKSKNQIEVKNQDDEQTGHKDVVHNDGVYEDTGNNYSSSDITNLRRVGSSHRACLPCASLREKNQVSTSPGSKNRTDF